MPDNKVFKSLLYENVVKKLAEIIDRGDVKPGEQFPPERELVKDMGVSRNVLREAFHILEEKGVVTSIQGKGRFLREAPSRQEADTTAFTLQKYSLLDIYQVRTIIEVGTMDILVETATEEDIRDLENLYDELHALFLKTKSTRGEFRMHMAYAEKSHNFYLQHLLKETTDLVRSIIWTDFSKIADTYDIESFAKDHAAIIAAIKRRDAPTARKTIKEHLQKATLEVDEFASRD